MSVLIIQWAAHRYVFHLFQQKKLGENNCAYCAKESHPHCFKKKKKNPHTLTEELNFACTCPKVTRKKIKEDLIKIVFFTFVLFYRSLRTPQEVPFNSGFRYHIIYHALCHKVSTSFILPQILQRIMAFLWPLPLK